jgi:hypothetical protein
MGLNRLLKFLQDERGQSTTEYILILSVVVMIAMKFKEKFGDVLGNMTERLGTGISTQIENNLGDQ